MVWPLLKKPLLGPLALANYRPVLNLSFLGKWQPSSSRLSWMTLPSWIPSSPSSTLVVGLRLYRSLTRTACRDTWIRADLLGAAGASWFNGSIQHSWLQSSDPPLCQCRNSGDSPSVVVFPSAWLGAQSGNWGKDFDAIPIGLQRPTRGSPLPSVI